MAKISLFVTKITYVVAEMRLAEIFKVTVVASLVVKITLAVTEITFLGAESVLKNRLSFKNLVCRDDDPLQRGFKKIVEHLIIYLCCTI